MHGTCLSIGIVLPTYNVADSVVDALRELEALFYGSHDEFEICIVDNASQDNTLNAIQDFLIDCELLTGRTRILQSSRNYGYGRSIKRGIQYYADREVSHVMILHSDGQTHLGQLATSLISGAEEGEPTNRRTVLGSRFSAASNIRHYNPVRKIGNYFFNQMTKWASGRALEDAGTAMALIPTTTLRMIDVERLPNDWRFHPALNIIISHQPRSEIIFVPMEWRDSRVRSSVPLLMYGFKLLQMLLHFGLVRRVRSNARAVCVLLRDDEFEGRNKW